MNIDLAGAGRKVDQHAASGTKLFGACLFMPETAVCVCGLV